MTTRLKMFKKIFILFFCFYYVSAFAQDKNFLIQRLLEREENRQLILKIQLSRNDFDKYAAAFNDNNLHNSNTYISSTEETFLACLVYYIANPEADSIKAKFYPLWIDVIKKRKLNSGGLASSSTDTVSIFKHMDTTQTVPLFTFQQLQNNPVLFKDFSLILETENEKNNFGSHNDIVGQFNNAKLNEENSSDQVSSYFNYQKLNDYFSYKIVKPVESKKFSLGRQTSYAALDSMNWHLDVSFSKIGISIEKFYQSVKNMSVGLELSSQENILNMLPFQSGSLVAGARLLLPFEGLEKDADGKEIITNKTKVLDFRLLDRFGANTNKLYGSPVLNLSTNVGIELKVSSFFGLFPIHATAFFWPKENYDNPPIKFSNNGFYTAYFSFYQAQFLSSFFKNLSDDGHHVINVDFGIAYYDVYKAKYDNNSKFLSTEKLATIWQPVVGIDYNLVLTKNSGRKEPILGLSSRILEQRIKLGFWLSLLNFANLDNDDLRIEITYITDAFFRSKQEYENPAGTFIQLRWRHGFSL